LAAQCGTLPGHCEKLFSLSGSILHGNKQPTASFSFAKDRPPRMLERGLLSGIYVSI